MSKWKREGRSSKSKRAGIRGSQAYGPFAHWARRWFAGTAACPRCGRGKPTVVDTRSGGDTRIETWACNGSTCAGRWRVELREGAVAVLDDSSGAQGEWYERAYVQTGVAFQIVIEDGVVRGVRVPTGAPVQEYFPAFSVREYQSDDALDADHVTAVDGNGRKYYEHTVAILGDEF